MLPSAVQRPAIQTRTNLPRWPLPLFNLVMLVLTAIPIIHMTQLLLTTGANTLGNDFIAIMPIIDRILNGNYNWLNFFRDSFLNGSHADAIPIAVLTIIAQIADLNDYVSISLGLLGTILVLVLTYDTLTHRIHHWTKTIILPIGAFLFFSNAQITTLVFNFTSFQLGFSFLGFMLGVWAIVHFPHTWRSIGLTVLGGCIAAWSAGFGVAAWPALFLCLVTQGYRDVRQYAVFLLGGVLAALPYLSFLQLGSSTLYMSATRFQLVLEIIGLPLGLYNPRSSLSIAGSFGIAVLLSGFMLIVYQSKRLLNTLVPPLITILYALLGAYITSLSRDNPAPWYTPFACFFWMGLAAFAVALVSQKTHRRLQILRWLWAGAFSIGFVSFYITASTVYLDKAMFMWVRTPASASCIRYFHTAPTFCEQMVFQWEVGFPNIIAAIADPLERHRLTNFASRQVWMLQGDFALDNVVLHEHSTIPEIQWSVEGSGTRMEAASWNDFRHANLFLHAPNSIDWTLAIPPNADEIIFSSAVAISESIIQQPAYPQTDGILFEVNIRLENGVVTTVYQQHVLGNDFAWHPFTIPLSAYVGQTIVLTLAANPINDVNYDWGLYRFPRVDVLLAPNSGTAPLLDLRQLIPHPASTDIVFPISDWQTLNIQTTPDDTSWLIDSDAVAYQSTTACFGDFTHFAIRLMAANASERNAIIVSLISGQTDESVAFDEQVVDQLRDNSFPSMTIPIHADGQSHTYTYPLRLLSLSNEDRLQGLGLRFRMQAGASIKIEDVRLLRSHGESSLCG